MGAWKYQIYFYALTSEISCSTLKINLVFPRTHVLFSIYWCELDQQKIKSKTVFYLILNK